MDVIGSQIISSMYLKYKICIFYLYSDTFGKKIISYLYFIFYCTMYLCFKYFLMKKTFFLSILVRGKPMVFLCMSVDIVNPPTCNISAAT